MTVLFFVSKPKQLSRTKTVIAAHTTSKPIWLHPLTKRNVSQQATGYNELTDYALEMIMNKFTKLAAGALLATLLTLPAFAQQPGAAPGAGPMAGAPSNQAGPGKGMRDCAQTASPEQCQARQAARQKAAEECKDVKGPERRQCMHSKMPPPDCSKAPNPQRCEAGFKAREACKEKTGPDHRQCMREQFKNLAPKNNPSTPPNPKS